MILSTRTLMDLAMKLYESCGFSVERTMRFGLPGSEMLTEAEQDREGATFYEKYVGAMAGKL